MSLKSVTDIPGIDYHDHRDSQYYGKYTYRARAIIPGIRTTWHVKTSDELKEPSSLKSFRAKDRKLIAANLEVLSAYIDWRNKLKENKSAMIRIEQNTVAVFSNDLDELRKLETLDQSNLLKVDYTEVRLGNELNVKYFVKEPAHKFRIYLKSKRVDPSFKDKMNSIIANNSTTLFPSDAFQRWLKSSSRYYSSNYTNYSHSIDYDDESMLSYIMLLYGNNFGKRYRLEKRPDPV